MPNPPLQNESSKLESFSEAITNLASKHEAKIISQTEEKRAALLREAQEGIELEISYLYTEQIADIRANAAARRLEAVNGMRESLYRKRSQMADSVFKMAEEKIRAFTASADYPRFMLQLCEKLAAEYDCATAEIQLRPEDFALLPQLKPLFPESCSFRSDTSISLGGLILFLPSLRILIDERLETRLQSERRHFYEFSNLSIYR